MANAIGNSGGRLYSFASAPVLIDCNFIVDPANGNGLGIRSLKGQGVRNVFMHTSSTPATHRGFLNPNPAVGYALIQLDGNYNSYLGGFQGFVSPTTGGNLSITAAGAALTAHNPYVITAVGTPPAGQATIAPVADVSGSLASKYFTVYDSYGNTFVVWFNVSGIGAPPSLGLGVAQGQRGLQYVQQTISSGATAAQVGTALATTLNNLPSGISGVNSFTATGTTTVTIVSTASAQLAGIPMDGASPLATGFTFALTVNNSFLGDWQGVGLPRGFVPTVGQSFFATNTGFGLTTGTVAAPGVSGIAAVEVIGNPNVQIAPMPQGGSVRTGGLIMVQFLGATNSSTTTLVPTAPATNSTCGMSFWVDMKFSPSNQGVNGTG